jgi:hypothetical protein
MDIELLQCHIQCHQEKSGGAMYPMIRNQAAQIFAFLECHGRNELVSRLRPQGLGSCLCNRVMLRFTTVYYHSAVFRDMFAHSIAAELMLTRVQSGGFLTGITVTTSLLLFVYGGVSNNVGTGLAPKFSP